MKPDNHVVSSHPIGASVVFKVCDKTIRALGLSCDARAVKGRKGAA
jgi:hypothetical protein